MKSTINDVARISGVSIGTVSRVLNNKPGVKPATRDKVQKVVKDLSFIPESAARDLSRGTSRTIGIHMYKGGLHLAPFSVLFFQDIMRHVLEQGGKVIDLPSKPNGLPHTTADGIILLGAYQGDPRIEFLDREKIPYVLVGHDFGKSWVAPDDIDGGRQVARYLLQCGHTSLIHATGQLELQASADRYIGFSRELKKSGITLTSDRILSNFPSSLTAYRAFSKYIVDKRDIFEDATAVFAGTDEIAVGVIAAIEDAGKSVPGDYTVIGFDDLPEIGNHLTTIHQDITLLAETSLKLLLEQLEGGEPRSQVLPVQLIVRNTSGVNISSL